MIDSDSNNVVQDDNGHEAVVVGSRIKVLINYIDFYMSPTKPFEEVLSDINLTSIQKDLSSFQLPIIRIFGRTPEMKSCLVHIHGYFPYFYIKVPLSFQNGSFQEKIDSLSSEIEDCSPCFVLKVG